MPEPMSDERLVEIEATVRARLLHVRPIHA